MRLTFIVNGEHVRVECEPLTPLVKILRDQLGLMGVHEGCSTGECGACAVLVNGKPAPSCLLVAADANGTEITTVEGITQTVSGRAIAEGFARAGAIQCGFCSPGFVVLTSALATSKAPPAKDAILHAVEGQLCRCTGYKKILEAIGEALKKEP